MTSCAHLCGAIVLLGHPWQNSKGGGKIDLPSFVVTVEVDGELPLSRSSNASPTFFGVGVTCSSGWKVIKSMRFSVVARIEAEDVGLLVSWGALDCLFFTFSISDPISGCFAEYDTSSKTGIRSTSIALQNMISQRSRHIWSHQQLICTASKRQPQQLCTSSLWGVCSMLFEQILSRFCSPIFWLLWPYICLLFLLKQGRTLSASLSLAHTSRFKSQNKSTIVSPRTLDSSYTRGAFCK